MKKLIQSNLKSKLLDVIFSVLVLVSAFIRFGEIKNYNFAFTFDQARDMLDLRVLGGFYDFQVSGPTTSITGLNLGPYYYIFNLPAYWVGGGDPKFLVYWNILWFLFSAICIYLFFRRKDNYLGFFFASFVIFAPQLFPITRYFWNANAVVSFIIFYLLAILNFKNKTDKLSAVLLGVSAGLVIQFEAAFGSLLVAFSLISVFLIGNKTLIKNYLFGLLPWFLPQIAFEIKNKFIMTKLFLGTLTGSNTILGDKIPISKIFVMHIKTISEFFEGQFMLPMGLGAVFLVVFVLFLLKTEYRKTLKYTLIFITFAVLYFTTIYHHPLKVWYLEGIRIWYCFIAALFFASFFEKKRININLISKYRFHFLIVLGIFLLRNLYLTVLDQNSYVKTSSVSDDPKNARNIITSIDWIYSKADGENFEAYSFVPEIYDYSYQYMYFWNGKNKHNYLPNIISYSLTDVPDYVRLSDKFVSTAGGGETEKIGLIYEEKTTYKDWLNQFSNYCLISKESFPWSVTAEWREKCKSF